MSDDKPGAQIIDMFAAWNAYAMKQRSTGEVAAPTFVESFDKKVKASLDIVHELATSVERVATLQAFDKAISACRSNSATDRGALIALSFLRDHIEKGEHCK